MMSAKTVFNIMKHNTLRLNDVLNKDLMEDDEVIEGYVTAFLVNRASLTLDKLNIITDFGDLTTMVELVRSVYNPGRKQTLTNTFIQVQGAILLNFGLGTSIHVDNAELDMYQSQEGIKSVASCNFPEAILNHTYVIQNTKAYFSQERTTFLFSTFYISGDANVTVSNFTFDNFYGNLQNAIGSFEIMLDEACIPQDDETHVVNISNSFMTLPENPDGDRFTDYYIDFSWGSTRKQIVNYHNNYHEHMDGYYPPFEVFGDFKTTVNVVNNTFINATSYYGSVHIYHLGEVTWKNTALVDLTTYFYVLAHCWL